ncbi:MAG TPA: carbohydrate porin [Candidatus Saccharimonadales bacterium]|nr:carbohydrate porin [Candidatus Saccharimonadales bacterium]
MVNIFSGIVLLLVFLLVYPAGAIHGQETPPSPLATATEDPGQNSNDTLVMFPHAEWEHWWLSGQANFISQYHPEFHSPYQGPHSLSPEAQDATSRVLTLFTGWKPGATTEFLCDLQETGGHGLGEALGVAGFFNLDVVRNPELSKAPYVARLMWHQIIPLGQKKVAVERTPFSLFRELPERRLEIRFGKFSLADFLDLNTYGTDTNFQFMNWAVDNNGAYDYAADTRGFTYAALVEFHDRNYIIRFAEALMPKVANGISLDADLARARAENVEFEIHGRVIGKQQGILRLLSYVNHANMGVYRQQVDEWLANPTTPVPEITNHPLQTTVKYGFGVNFEQPFNDWIGAFGRWGWNEGQHESYAYTEVDQTWQIGVGGVGTRWGRKFDRMGLVFVSNGINHEHARYLGYGGLGFLLGDGQLNYGRETIIESYYTVHLWRGIFPAAGLQYVWNPGYNRDRGPVLVPTLRLHLEF